MSAEQKNKILKLTIIFSLGVIVILGALLVNNGKYGLFLPFKLKKLSTSQNIETVDFKKVLGIEGDSDKYAFVTYADFNGDEKKDALVTVYTSGDSKRDQYIFGYMGNELTKWLDVAEEKINQASLFKLDNPGQPEVVATDSKTVAIKFAVDLSVSASEAKIRSLYYTFKEGKFVYDRYEDKELFEVNEDITTVDFPSLLNITPQE